MLGLWIALVCYVAAIHFSLPGVPLGPERFEDTVDLAKRLCECPILSVHQDRVIARKHRDRVERVIFLFTFSVCAPPFCTRHHGFVQASLS